MEEYVSVIIGGIYISFFLDGLLFMSAYGTVGWGVNCASTSIILCMGSNNRLGGIFIGESKKYPASYILSKVKATVCSEEVSGFVAKYAMLSPEIYENSFIKNLVKVGS